MGYSRASFGEVHRQLGRKRRHRCAGPCEAFDYFGGEPEHVLFDNTKSVLVERDAYGAGLHRWNGERMELAQTCGFTPRLFRLRRAKTKGEVERFNAHLKGNFLVPLA